MLSWKLQKKSKFIFAGAALPIIAFSTFISSAIKLEAKLELLMDFSVHQSFIENFFQLQKTFPSLETLRGNITSQFACFSMLTSLCYVGSVCFTAFYNTDGLLFSLHYQVMTMIVHAQSFQILEFSKISEHQLQAFNGIKIGKLNENGLKTLKGTIIDIFGHVQQSNKVFSSVMVLTLFWIYSSVLSNLHWIGLSFLGEQNATCLGKLKFEIFENPNWFYDAEGIICISPNILIIAYFGCANLKMQSTLKCTIDKIAKSKIPEDLKEDILIFMLRKSFQLTSFNFFSCNFSMMSKVSW